MLRDNEGLQRLVKHFRLGHSTCVPVVAFMAYDGISELVVAEVLA